MSTKSGNNPQVSLVSCSDNFFKSIPHLPAVSPAFLCLLIVQNPMDVEEFVRRRIADGTDESVLQKSLADRILEFKSVPPLYASAFAHAVIDEVKNCDFLIVYTEDGEFLKGALIEMCIAMGFGIPIFLIGQVLKPDSIFTYYSLIHQCNSIKEALNIINKI